MTESRVPAGVPTGGQFAASAKGEATGVDLAPAPAFGAECENQYLVGRINAVMDREGSSGEIRAEDGTYPGTVRLNSPYEGELVHLAEQFAHDGLYVNLREDQSVWGDPETGFEFTVADKDEYGSHNTWMTGDDFY